MRAPRLILATLGTSEDEGTASSASESETMSTKSISTSSSPSCPFFARLWGGGAPGALVCKVGSRCLTNVTRQANLVQQAVLAGPSTRRSPASTSAERVYIVSMMMTAGRLRLDLASQRWEAQRGNVTFGTARHKAKSKCLPEALLHDAQNVFGNFIVKRC